LRRVFRFCYMLRMRLLITGGCGFIGSNFVRFLLDHYQPEFVTNVDALTYAGNPENLAGVAERFGERYDFFQCDIGDREAMETIFASHKFYAVVNFAAESHVDRSISQPGNFIHTNVIGTEVLLEAARKHGVKRFLQVSTDEVYGSLGADGRFTEKTPLDPSSPYSASKASADLLALAAYKTFGQEAVITRCSNNYGPYQFPEKLIPLMITNALADKQLPVYGDGLNVRDWIHVEDHCRGVMAVLLEGRAGEVYNIGAGGEMENIAVVELILETLGKPRELISYVTDRLGHDRRYAIDSTKIQTELGWKPLHMPRDGIRETVKWYLENRQWWEPLLPKPAGV
jgi:dTDP-glucose 4,6-dehydratase